MNTSVKSKNMRLLGHNDLAGFGNGGEGLGLQVKNGKRYLYIAHESAPKNFTVVDVSDPREPAVVAQTELPHTKVRSNSLDVVGDLLAVAYQTAEPGLTPAGVELFDVSDPENPRSIAFFDRSGPYSQGVHCLWFVDGEYMHITTGAADHEPIDSRDHQMYQIVDVRDPAHPAEVGRWWLPGTRRGDEDPPPIRHTRFDAGFRPHNTNVYPERPDRAYVAYIDGGIVILDIADKAHPKMISRLDYHPPMTGFTHTVLPLFSRDTLIVTDEAVRPGGEDWPKPAWVVDMRDEEHLLTIGTLPLPPLSEFPGEKARYGAHNIHENHPLPTAFRSDDLVFGAFFSAGIRAYDVTNPFTPVEMGYYIPEPPEGSPVGQAQMNDVYVDENRIIYGIDRFKGGLYTLELTV
jgi:hypothetical protein